MESVVDVDVSLKEGRSRRNRVMEQAMQALGEKVKAATADGDDVRARQLLNQLQVRVLKRTRSIKRSSSCKKISVLETEAGNRRRPQTPPPVVQPWVQPCDVWRQREYFYAELSTGSGSSSAPSEASEEELLVNIVEIGAMEKEIDCGGDRSRDRRRPATEIVLFFLKRNCFLFLFLFLCFFVLLVSK